MFWPGLQGLPQVLFGAGTCWTRWIQVQAGGPLSRQEGQGIAGFANDLVRRHVKPFWLGFEQPGRSDARSVLRCGDERCGTAGASATGDRRTPAQGAVPWQALAVHCQGKRHAPQVPAAGDPMPRCFQLRQQAAACLVKCQATSGWLGGIRLG